MNHATVPPSSARAGLRLICLRCRKSGVYQPVATLRPRPPRTLPPDHWPNALGERARAAPEQYLPLGLGLYLSPMLPDAAPGTSNGQPTEHPEPKHPRG